MVICPGLPSVAGPVLQRHYLSLFLKIPRAISILTPFTDEETKGTGTE